MIYRTLDLIVLFLAHKISNPNMCVMVQSKIHNSAVSIKLQLKMLSYQNIKLFLPGMSKYAKAPTNKSLLIHCAQNKHFITIAAHLGLLL